MSDSIYVNPFVTITRIRTQNEFNVIYRGETTNITPEQSEYLCSVRVTNRYELAKHFEHCDIDDMLEKKILLTEPVDINARDSRTEGYFLGIDMLEAYRFAKNSHVLILGAGGLGSHVAWNMCAFGIKKLTILDFDTVEETNLNRQLVYDVSDIGKLKTDVLKKRLSEQNPNCEIITIEKRIENIDDIRSFLSDDVNLVVRAADTPLEIMSWVFSACEEAGKPYVTGGLLGASVSNGPTYVPGFSPRSSSILVNGLPLGTTSDFEQMYGTVASSGFAMYKLSAEVMLEAVKILTGRNDALKFSGRISIESLFEDAGTDGDTGESADEASENVGGLKLGLFVVIVVAVASVTLFFSRGAFIFLVYEYTLLAFLTLLVWERNRDIILYKATMVCGALVGSISTLGSVLMGNLAFISFDGVQATLRTFGMLLFSTVLTVCLHSVLFLGLVELFKYILRKLR